MSQHLISDLDIVPEVTSGTQLSEILDRLHDAYNTGHSGSARPPYAVQGTIWIDTDFDPPKVMLYTGADDIEIGRLPPGGDAGQVLAKIDSVDGNAEWIDPPEGGGGGLEWSVTAADVALTESGKGYMISTLDGEKTVTLNPAPLEGERVGVLDIAGNFGTNKVTVIRNGKKIMGEDEDMELASNNRSIIFVFGEDINGWRIEMTTPCGTSDGGGGGAGVPVGSIIAHVGGYFTAHDNVGYTPLLYTDGAELNALLNPDGWYFCDGSELNLPGSPIFDGAGRWLPTLTNDRFIQGDAVSTMGESGGANVDSHTHSLNSHTHNTDIPSTTSSSTTISTSTMPSHRHSITTYRDTVSTAGIYANRSATAYTKYTGYTGSGGSHNHTVNPASRASGGPSNNNTGGATVTENRPLYLSCAYIIRAI